MNGFLRNAAMAAALSLSSFGAAIGITGPSLAGQVTTLDLSDARKVVSIGGSVTEIIYALGAEDRLVARDSTSVYPPEALSLPDAGYIRALSPEGVLSTGLDSLLALEGSGPPETMDVLREAEVPIVMVPESYSAEGILEKVRVVGSALGLSDKAEELAGRLKDDLASATALAAERKAPVSALFVLSLRGGNVLASGEGTAAAGMMRLAHLDNAVSGFQGYKALSNEAVTEAAPDIILMMSNAGDHSATQNSVLAHPTLSLTPAAREGRVIAMDGQFLLGFGPRTAQAIRELSENIAKGGLEQVAK